MVAVINIRGDFAPLPILTQHPRFPLGCALLVCGSSDSKESACNVGDLGLIPGLTKSPGEGNSIPLQCSYLENPMDGGAWQATVHGVAKS